jgi:uncharacterized NAD(P)/FAD-binding protein YdhS
MQIKQVVFSQPSRYVDVAIVGAGFSGSMVAIHLAHTLRGVFEIALIEKARRAGPGIAYSTENPLHLLNVPVGRMGAYPERPRHFYEWLKEHPALVHRYNLDPLTEGAFVPRRLYGLYLELLVHRLALQSGRVHRFEQEAVDLAEAPDRSFRLCLKVSKEPHDEPLRNYRQATRSKSNGTKNRPPMRMRLSSYWALRSIYGHP